MSGIAEMLRRLAECEAMAASYRSEAKSAQGRAQEREAEAEQIRLTIRNRLECAGIARLETAAGTVSLEAAPAKVIVTGEFPDEFARITREPDKLKIREALVKDGLVLDFAVMSNREMILKVKK